MDPSNTPYEPLDLLVVVRRAPRLVFPARDTPTTIFYLPPVHAYVGLGSVLSSHMLLFEPPHHQSFGSYGGEVRSPSPAIVRGLEKVLCLYYPFAGRLRAPGAGAADHGKLELVCQGQGAVFVEAQANVSLAELKKLDKSYWQELHYDFVGDSPSEVPPLVIQVTTLTCGGFALSIRVLQNLCDSAGVLHFLHAWSEFTKSSQNANIAIPLWGGIVPSQLAEWPQKFHFPSLELAHGPEEYAHAQDKVRYMESTRDQSYYDNAYSSTNDRKLHYMEARDQPYYDNVHGLSHDHKLQYMENKDQSYYDAALGLTSVSVSLESLSMLKDSIRIKCNRFEALAALCWRERTRALALPHSSEVLLFFPAPVAHDVHLAFYGQYAFNCVVSARAGDLVQSDLSEVVAMIQEAKALMEGNFIQCMRKFAQVHCPAKRAPPNALIFTVLWDGASEIDFGTGGVPYAADATRLRSPVNVAAITGGLEDTIEIVMTNAPPILADKISLHAPPTRPLLTDSRL